MSKFFVATVGALFGVYLAQNYDLPNIKGVVNKGLKVAKEWESKNRK